MKPNTEIRPSATFPFKLSIIILLFFLTLCRVLNLMFMPSLTIIPDDRYIYVILIVIAYLWIQEVRDRNKLLNLNLELVIAHKQLQLAEIDTISSLVIVLEAKDPYTRGHSEMVTKYSLRLGEEMGLSENELGLIRRAGILHDIGKISISDAVLHKPDKLTDEEWRMITTHPDKAVEILEPLKFLVQEKEIIRHHHEKFAGGGYPSGLKGEEIPLGARILSVADTFDAMNSARPYRGKKSKEEIIAELKRVSGTQLDPQITELFLKLLSKDQTLWLR
jgi:putative nucleotidyltransferase with HDIG domain